MIGIILLTGFLGAGKTTLMSNLLYEYQGKKVGVIINEFGSINIDAVLIKRSGIEMAELTNGSIFCACLKENFIGSLIEMSGKDIEYLFIEASGLADPSNIRQILKAIECKVVRPYNYLGAVAVVDLPNFLELYELLPALHRQVEYSSAAILNKADLASPDRIEATKSLLYRINPNIGIHIATYCKVDMSNLLGTLAEPGEKAEESTNTIESRPKTYVLTGEEPLPYEGLKSFLTFISPYTYRIKGFTQTDRGPYEISAVGPAVSLIPWREELGITEAVLISSVGIKIVSVITKGINKYLEGKIHL